MACTYVLFGDVEFVIFGDTEESVHMCAALATCIALCAVLEWMCVFDGSFCLVV